METEYVEEEMRVPRDSAVDRTLERVVTYALWGLCIFACLTVCSIVAKASKKDGITAGEWNVRKEAIELGYGRIEKGFFVWNTK